MDASRPRRSNAAVIVLAVGSLAALPKEKEGAWVEVLTPHFVVVTNSGEGTTRKTAVEFERIRAALHAVLPVFATASHRPFLVVGAKDEATLKTLLPEYWEKGEGTSGLYMPSRERTLVALRVDRSPGKGEDPSMAYWSYASDALTRSFPALPLWAHRGLAEFFSYTTIEKDRVLLGRAASHHVGTLRQARLIPAETLLSIDRDSTWWTDSERRRVFDAESWALVHLLLLDQKGAWRSRLGEYLERHGQGAGDAEAGRAAFGDLGRLTEALESYVRRYAFYAQELRASVDASAERYPLRKLGVAEAYALRGAVHVAAGRPREAREALDRAVQLDPRLAAPHESLAVLAYDARDEAGARAAAQRARELDPESAIAAEVLGWLGVGLRTVRRDEVLRIEADCTKGAPGRCRDLAHILLAEGSEVKDPARAASILAGLCEKGQVADCQELGGRYLEGAGLPKDALRAMAFLERACQLEDLRSCLVAGSHLVHGRDVPADPGRAARLFDRACAAGEAGGCTSLAIQHLTGEGAPRDYVKAAALLDQACEKGDPHGCGALARLLAQGQGVPKDVERARALYRRSCDGGQSTACDELGRLTP